MFKLEEVKLVTMRGSTVAQAAKGHGAHENIPLERVRMLRDRQQEEFPCCDIRSARMACLRSCARRLPSLWCRGMFLPRPGHTSLNSPCEVRVHRDTLMGEARQSGVRGSTLGSHGPGAGDTSGKVGWCASAPPLFTQPPHLLRMLRVAGRAGALKSLRAAMD